MGVGGSADVAREARRATEVLNAILYVLWTVCQWKALPKDQPPRSTVWAYLDRREWDGTLTRIHHALYVEAGCRRGARPAPPSRS